MELAEARFFELTQLPVKVSPRALIILEDSLLRRGTSMDLLFSYQAAHSLSVDAFSRHRRGQYRFAKHVLVRSNSDIRKLHFSNLAMRCEKPMFMRSEWADFKKVF